jgi:hypothetical protein
LPLCIKPRREKNGYTHRTIFRLRVAFTSGRMVRLLYRAIIGIVLNAFMITALSIFISVSRNQFLMTFGPRQSLVFMGAIMDTWQKYIILLAMTSFMSVIRAIVWDFSMPIMLFTVYNHKTEVVYGFSRAQLQTCCTLLNFTTTVAHIFSINAAVTSVDVAFISSCAGEVMAFIISFFLIAQKTAFIKKYDSEEEAGIEKGEPLAGTGDLT